MNAPEENKRPSVISVSIKDKQALYMAYMPFVENGGVFIQSKKDYRMGEEVFLLLKIMDDSNQIPVAGRVAWITPENAQDSRSKGIGIQFTDNDAPMVVSKIEAKLGESLKSARRTHTM